MDEHEPDYRVSLAAERTYLAYLRTGLGLIAAGVAVAVALPDIGAVTVRRIIGIALVLSGGIASWEGRRRFTAIQAAIRGGHELPKSGIAQALSWIIIVIALASVALLALI